MALNVSAALPDKFVRAIHLTETGGRVGAIRGDGGKALGPLQIHYACWKDCNVPGTYNQCTNLAYSTKVMEAYMNKYARKYIASKDFQSMARIWNGGPAGYRRAATIGYWNKVKHNLDK